MFFDLISAGCRLFSSPPLRNIKSATERQTTGRPRVSRARRLNISFGPQQEGERHLAPRAAPGSYEGRFKEGTLQGNDPLTAFSQLLPRVPSSQHYLSPRLSPARVPDVR